MDGKVGKYGFYQTLFLESDSPEDAESIAVKKVRSNTALNTAVLNDNDDPPTMHVETLAQIQAFPKNCQQETGRAWYSEDEETKTSNHGLESTGAPPAAGTPETHP